MKYLLAILVGLCALGCKSAPRPPVATQPTTSQINSQIDPNYDGPILVHLDVYQLTMPLGAVSDSDAFWKRIDENAVDVATYDLLFRNGLRVGEAPLSDWAYFKSIIAENPASTKKISVEGVEVKSLDLEMTKDYDEQSIFFFDGREATPVGRTYDKSRNVMTLSFQLAPRRDGVRIALVPTVQATRKRLEFTPMNQEVEVQYVKPERLYECNLRTEIKAEKFLVIGPSPVARQQWSIGNRFLIKQGEAELEEQVLLIVPQLIRLQNPVATK